MIAFAPLHPGWLATRQLNTEAGDKRTGTGLAPQAVKLRPGETDARAGPGTLTVQKLPAPGFRRTP